MVNDDDFPSTDVVILYLFVVDIIVGVFVVYADLVVYSEYKYLSFVCLFTNLSICCYSM
jgi:hypothetical protein